jgi:hypothetical protein
MEIELTVDRIEGDKVVLISNDQIKFLWPKFKLPKNIKEGDVFCFSILEKKEQEEKKNQQAKELLNEILKIEQ